MPLAGLIALGWTGMLLLLARGVLTRRRGTIVPLAALCIAVLALLHSCIDFTLQVPGYTIPFFALFGAGMAQAFRTPRKLPAVQADNAEEVAGCAEELGNANNRLD